MRICYYHLFIILLRFVPDLAIDDPFTLAALSFHMSSSFFEHILLLGPTQHLIYTLSQPWNQLSKQPSFLLLEDGIKKLKSGHSVCSLLMECHCFQSSIDRAGKYRCVLSNSNTRQVIPPSLSSHVLSTFNELLSPRIHIKSFQNC